MGARTPKIVKIPMSYNGPPTYQPSRIASPPPPPKKWSKAEQMRYDEQCRLRREREEDDFARRNQDGLLTMLLGAVGLSMFND